MKKFLFLLAALFCGLSAQAIPLDFNTSTGAIDNLPPGVAANFPTGGLKINGVAVGTGTVSSITVPSWLTAGTATAGNIAITGTSESANLFLASPNGSSGAMTPRAIVAADIPTLNQSTTGTATNVTGTVAVANGGTGVATLTAYAPIFGGTTSTGAVQSGTVGTSGQVLTSNGAGALPTFQTPSAGLTNPMTTLGDTIFGGASGTATRLAGYTTSGIAILSQTGTGSASAAPAWLATSGSGNVALTTSPSFTTPSLGVATATSINGNAITTGSGTLTLGAGKTFTASNTLTLAGTDSSTLNIGTGGTLGTAAYTASTAYAPTIGSSSITTLGTIGSGIWQGTLIGPTYGGTGVNNGSSTLTIGGNFAMSGAYTFGGTLTANTAVTFPTSGTLATTTGSGAALTGLISSQIGAPASTTNPGSGNVGTGCSFISGASTGGTLSQGGTIAITGATATGGSSANIGGNINITGGAATGTTTVATTGGTVTINGGNATGSSSLTLGSVTIGSANTAAVQLGSSGGATINIYGTTAANNATTGCVGQFINSKIASGSAVSLTTATPANVTSISLTAGDWSVEGNINFSGTGATTSQFTGGITTTSATLPTDGSEVNSSVPMVAVSAINGLTIPRVRISISSTTTVYLVGSCTFTAGSESGYGSISAIRVR